MPDALWVVPSPFFSASFFLVSLQETVAAMHHSSCNDICNLPSGQLACHTDNQTAGRSKVKIRTKVRAKRKTVQTGCSQR